MFTELVIDDKNSILSTMLARVSSILRDKLTFEQFNQISISFHFFPDKWDHDITQRPSNPTLYPDLSHRDDSTRIRSGIKRMMDIIGSALILVICAPVLLIIALAIKGSSKGPVLFQATAGRTIREVLHVSEIQVDVCRQRLQHSSRNM